MFYEIRDMTCCSETCDYSILLYSRERCSLSLEECRVCIIFNYVFRLIWYLYDWDNLFYLLLSNRASSASFFLYYSYHININYMSRSLRYATGINLYRIASSNISHIDFHYIVLILSIWVATLISKNFWENDCWHSTIPFNGMRCARVGSLSVDTLLQCITGPHPNKTLVYISTKRVISWARDAHELSYGFF